MKRNAKNKSHMSTELNIIKGYLVRGRHIDHNPLLEQGIQQWKVGGSLCFTTAFIV